MTDKEIIRVAKGFTKGLLGKKSTVDMCYVVCSPLVGYLSMLGVDCRLTDGYIDHCEAELHHFWITLSDGKIIDPTADQFGLLNSWVVNQPSNYKVKQTLLGTGA